MNWPEEIRTAATKTELATRMCLANIVDRVTVKRQSHKQVLAVAFSAAMCQTPSKRQTDKRIETPPFVRCVCQGRPSYGGWTKRDAS